MNLNVSVMNLKQEDILGKLGGYNTNDFLLMLIKMAAIVHNSVDQLCLIIYEGFMCCFLECTANS